MSEERKTQEVEVYESGEWENEFTGPDLIAWIERLMLTYSKCVKYKRGQLGTAETIPGTLKFHIQNLTARVKCYETDFQYETRLRGEIIDQENIEKRERTELKRLRDKYEE
jgi:hypothetical protein